MGDTCIVNHLYENKEICKMEQREEFVHEALKHRKPF